MDKRIYELLDALEDVVIQGCQLRRKDGEEILDSMAIRAYANALHILARYGRAKILSEAGTRVIARTVSGLRRSSETWEFLYLALGLTRPEWWQVFMGESLEDPLVKSVWEKARNEKDPKRALLLLTSEVRALLEEKISEIKDDEKMARIFLSCHTKARKRIHERKVSALKAEMMKVPENKRAEILTLYMEEVKKLKSLDPGEL